MKFVGNFRVAITLAVAVAAMIIVAEEVAGFTVNGWHSISYQAQQPTAQGLTLRLLILAGAGDFGAWWWVHTGRQSPRIIVKRFFNL